MKEDVHFTTTAEQLIIVYFIVIVKHYRWICGGKNPVIHLFGFLMQSKNSKSHLVQQSTQSIISRYLIVDNDWGQAFWRGVGGWFYVNIRENFMSLLLICATDIQAASSVP